MLPGGPRLSFGSEFNFNSNDSLNVQIAESLNRGDFYYALLSLLLLIIWAIYLLFYNARLVGLVVSFIARRFVKDAFIRFGSISLSALGGKVMIRDLAYMTKDYSIKCCYAIVVFNYWTPYKPTDEPSSNIRPCGNRCLYIYLYGLDAHVYNRTAVYEDLRRLFNGARDSPLQPTDQYSWLQNVKAFLLRRRVEQQLPEAGVKPSFMDIFWSHAYRLIPSIKFNLELTKLCAGNHLLPRACMLSCRSLVGNYSRANPTQSADKYQHRIQADFAELLCSLIPVLEYSGQHATEIPPINSYGNYNIFHFKRGKMKYLQDEPGLVSNEPDQVYMRGTEATMLQTWPYWGLDVTVTKGCHLHYGPWADRQRDILWRFFFPASYEPASISEPPAYGQPRVVRKFVFDFKTTTDVTLELHFTQNTDVKHLKLSAVAESYAKFILPWLTDATGFQSTFRTCLVQCSLVAQHLWADVLHSKQVDLDLTMVYPREWNSPQTWTMDVKAKQPRFTMLFDYKHLFKALVNDWIRGAHSDLLHFVPCTYKFLINAENLNFILLANDYNWVSSTLENAYIAFAGQRLHLSFDLDFMDFLPDVVPIVYEIKLVSGKLLLSLPETSTMLHVVREQHSHLKLVDYKGRPQTKQIFSVYEDTGVQNTSEPRRHWVECGRTPMIHLKIAYTYHPSPWVPECWQFVPPEMRPEMPSAESASERKHPRRRKTGMHMEKVEAESDYSSQADLEELVIRGLRPEGSRARGPTEGYLLQNDFDIAYLPPDTVDVHLHIPSAQLCVYGALLRHFFHLKDNYFGYYQKPVDFSGSPMSAEDYLQSISDPSSTSRRFDRFELKTHERLVDPRDYRPLLVRLSLEFHNIQAHLPMSGSSWMVPCPTAFLDCIGFEMDKRWHETKLQLLFSPILLCVSDECKSLRPSPYSTLSTGCVQLMGLCMRGQGMFSHVGLPLDAETLEYAWLIDLTVGQLTGRVTAPQLSTLVRCVEGFVFSALDGENQLNCSRAFELCQHAQPQTHCRYRPAAPNMTCPGEMELKYRLVRVSVDGVDLAIMESGCCMSLQLAPIRLTNCNMHGNARCNGLFVYMPSVRLHQFIRQIVGGSTRMQKCSDSADTMVPDYQTRWLEAGSLSLGPIQVNVSLLAEQPQLPQWQLKFLKRHDAATKRLWFLWSPRLMSDRTTTSSHGKNVLLSQNQTSFIPGTSPLCGCFGHCSFFGSNLSGCILLDELLSGDFKTRSMFPKQRDYQYSDADRPEDPLSLLPADLYPDNISIHTTAHDNQPEAALPAVLFGESLLRRHRLLHELHDPNSCRERSNGLLLMREEVLSTYILPERDSEPSGPCCDEIDQYDLDESSSSSSSAAQPSFASSLSSAQFVGQLSDSTQRKHRRHFSSDPNAQPSSLYEPLVPPDSPDLEDVLSFGLHSDGTGEQSIDVPPTNRGSIGHIPEDLFLNTILNNMTPSSSQTSVGLPDQQGTLTTTQPTETAQGLPEPPVPPPRRFGTVQDSAQCPTESLSKSPLSAPTMLDDASEGCINLQGQLNRPITESSLLRSAYGHHLSAYRCVNIWDRSMRLSLRWHLCKHRYTVDRSPSVSVSNQSMRSDKSLKSYGLGNALPPRFILIERGLSLESLDNKSSQTATSTNKATNKPDPNNSTHSNIIVCLHNSVNLLVSPLFTEAMDRYVRMLSPIMANLPPSTVVDQMHTHCVQLKSAELKESDGSSPTAISAALVGDHFFSVSSPHPSAVHESKSRLFKTQEQAQPAVPSVRFRNPRHKISAPAILCVEPDEIVQPDHDLASIAENIDNLPQVPSTRSPLHEQSGASLTTNEPNVRMRRKSDTYNLVPVSRNDVRPAEIMALSLQRLNIGFVQLYTVEDVIHLDTLRSGLLDLTCVSLLTLCVDTVSCESMTYHRSKSTSPPYVTLRPKDESDVSDHSESGLAPLLKKSISEVIQPDRTSRMVGTYAEPNDADHSFTSMTAPLIACTSLPEQEILKDSEPSDNSPSNRPTHARQPSAPSVLTHSWTSDVANQPVDQMVKDVDIFPSKNIPSDLNAILSNQTPNIGEVPEPVLPIETSTVPDNSSQCLRGAIRDLNVGRIHCQLRRLTRRSHFDPHVLLTAIPFDSSRTFFVYDSDKEFLSTTSVPCRSSIWDEHCTGWIMFECGLERLSLAYTRQNSPECKSQNDQNADDQLYVEVVPPVQKSTWKNLGGRKMRSDVHSKIWTGKPLTTKKKKMATVLEETASKEDFRVSSQTDKDEQSVADTACDQDNLTNANKGVRIKLNVATVWLNFPTPKRLPNKRRVELVRSDWNLLSTAAPAFKAWMDPVDRLIAVCHKLYGGVKRRCLSVTTCLMIEAIKYKNISGNLLFPIHFLDEEGFDAYARQRTKTARALSLDPSCQLFVVLRRYLLFMNQQYGAVEVDRLLNEWLRDSEVPPNEVLQCGVLSLTREWRVFVDRLIMLQQNSNTQNVISSNNLKTPAILPDQNSIPASHLLDIASGPLANELRSSCRWTPQSNFFDQPRAASVLSSNPGLGDRKENESFNLDQSVVNLESHALKATICNEGLFEADVISKGSAEKLMLQRYLQSIPQPTPQIQKRPSGVTDPSKPTSFKRRISASEYRAYDGQPGNGPSVQWNITDEVAGAGPRKTPLVDLANSSSMNGNQFRLSPTDYDQVVHLNARYREVIFIQHFFAPLLESIGLNEKGIRRTTLMKKFGGFLHADGLLQQFQIEIVSSLRNPLSTHKSLAMRKPSSPSNPLGPSTSAFLKPRTPQVGRQLAFLCHQFTSKVTFRDTLGVTVSTRRQSTSSLPNIRQTTTTIDVMLNIACLRQHINMSLLRLLHQFLTMFYCARDTQKTIQSEYRMSHRSPIPPPIYPVDSKLESKCSSEATDETFHSHSSGYVLLSTGSGQRSTTARPGEPLPPIIHWGGAFHKDDRQYGVQQSSGEASLSSAEKSSHKLDFLIDSGLVDSSMPFDHTDMPERSVPDCWCRLKKYVDIYRTVPKTRMLNRKQIDSTGQPNNMPTISEETAHHGLLEPDGDKSSANQVQGATPTAVNKSAVFVRRLQSTINYRPLNEDPESGISLSDQSTQQPYPGIDTSHPVEDNVPANFGYSVRHGSKSQPIVVDQLTYPWLCGERVPLVIFVSTQIHQVSLSAVLSELNLDANVRDGHISFAHSTKLRGRGYFADRCLEQSVTVRSGRGQLRLTEKSSISVQDVVQVRSNSSFGLLSSRRTAKSEYNSCLVNVGHIKISLPHHPVQLHGVVQRQAKLISHQVSELLRSAPAARHPHSREGLDGATATSSRSVTTPTTGSASTTTTATVSDGPTPRPQQQLSFILPTQMDTSKQHTPVLEVNLMAVAQGLTIDVALHPSLAAVYELRPVHFVGKIGPRGYLEVHLNEHCLRLNSLSPPGNFPRSIEIALPQVLTTMARPSQFGPRLARSLTPRPSDHLCVYINVGTIEQNLTTDMLNYIIIVSKLFMKEINDVIQKMAGEEQVPNRNRMRTSIGDYSAESLNERARKAWKFTFKIRFAEIQLIATTRCGAVKFEAVNIETEITNRVSQASLNTVYVAQTGGSYKLPKNGLGAVRPTYLKLPPPQADTPSMEVTGHGEPLFIHGTVAKVGIEMGCFDQDMLYDERTPEFRTVAFFRTSIALRSLLADERSTGQTSRQDNRSSSVSQTDTRTGHEHDAFLISVTRPIIWMKPFTFDRAILIWMVYKDEFAKWKDHMEYLSSVTPAVDGKKSTNSDCTSQRLKSYMRSQSCYLESMFTITASSDPNAETGSDKGVAESARTKVSSSHPTRSTLFLQLNVVDLGICLPLNTMSATANTLDSRTALVLTLDHSRISACYRGSLVSQGEFTDFCLRFDDEFNVGSDDWKPDRKRASVDVNGKRNVMILNACVVPSGSFNVCWRDWEKSAQWHLLVHWNMKGLDFHLADNIGRRLNALLSTLTNITGSSGAAPLMQTSAEEDEAFADDLIGPAKTDINLGDLSDTKQASQIGESSANYWRIRSLELDRVKQERLEAQYCLDFKRHKWGTLSRKNRPGSSKTQSPSFPRAASKTETMQSPPALVKESASNLHIRSDGRESTSESSIYIDFCKPDIRRMSVMSRGCDSVYLDLENGDSVHGGSSTLRNIDRQSQGTDRESDIWFDPMDAAYADTMYSSPSSYVDAETFIGGDLHDTDDSSDEDMDMTIGGPDPECSSPPPDRNHLCDNLSETIIQSKILLKVDANIHVDSGCCILHPRIPQENAESNPAAPKESFSSTLYSTGNPINSPFRSHVDSTTRLPCSDPLNAYLDRYKQYLLQDHPFIPTKLTVIFLPAVDIGVHYDTMTALGIPTVPQSTPATYSLRRNPTSAVTLTAFSTGSGSSTKEDVVDQPPPVQRLTEVNAHSKGFVETVPETSSGSGLKKETDLCVSCSIQRLPKELIVHPSLLDFLEQALENLPLHTDPVVSAPSDDDDNNNKEQTQTKDVSSSSSTSFDMNIFESFPLHVIFHLHVEPWTIRLLCLPTSRMQCLLTLPFLDVIFSTKRQVGEDLLARVQSTQEGGHELPKYNMGTTARSLSNSVARDILQESGLCVTAQLKEFRIAVSHTYVDTEALLSIPMRTSSGSSDSLTLVLRDIQINLSRSVRTSLVQISGRTNNLMDQLTDQVPTAAGRSSPSHNFTGTSPNSSKVDTWGRHRDVHFSVVSNVGLTLFTCDTRRIREVMDIPKVWYRNTLARRLVFGYDENDMATIGQVDEPVPDTDGQSVPDHSESEDRQSQVARPSTSKSQQEPSALTTGLGYHTSKRHSKIADFFDPTNTLLPKSSRTPTCSRPRSVTMNTSSRVNTLPTDQRGISPGASLKLASWHAAPIFCVHFKHIDLGLFMGSVMGETRLTMDRLFCDGRMSLDSNARKNTILSTGIGTCQFASEGGCIGGEMCLLNTECRLYILEDPLQDPQHHLDTSMDGFQFRISYMDTNILMMRVNSFNMSLRDEWKLRAAAQQWVKRTAVQKKRNKHRFTLGEEPSPGFEWAEAAEPEVGTSPVFIRIVGEVNWDQAQAAVVRTTTPDLIKAIQKLQDYFLEQFREGRMSLTEPSGYGPAAGARSSQRMGFGGESNVYGGESDSIEIGNALIDRFLHRHWQRLLTDAVKAYVSEQIGDRLDVGGGDLQFFPNNVDQTWPVLGGSFQLTGRSLGLACFAGNFRSAPDWAVFNIQYPTACFETEAQRELLPPGHTVQNPYESDGWVNIRQVLSFDLGSQPEFRPQMAYVIRVRRGMQPNLPTTLTLSIEDWFEFTFSGVDNSVIMFVRNNDLASVDNVVQLSKFPVAFPKPIPPRMSTTIFRTGHPTSSKKDPHETQSPVTESRTAASARPTRSNPLKPPIEGELLFVLPSISLRVTSDQQQSMLRPSKKDLVSDQPTEAEPSTHLPVVASAPVMVNDGTMHSHVSDHKAARWWMGKPTIKAPEPSAAVQSSSIPPRLSPIVKISFQTDFHGLVQLGLIDVPWLPTLIASYLNEKLNDYEIPGTFTDPRVVPSEHTRLLEMASTKSPLVQDLRSYDTIHWSLSPMCRWLMASNISVPAFDRLLEHIGFQRASSTIPKWLQRGVMDHLDRFVSLLIHASMQLVLDPPPLTDTTEKEIEDANDEHP